MVPVMCRRIALTSVLGLLAAGMGCNHIGGKSDCGANPADAVIAGPTPPYTTWAATAPTGAPIGMPAPNTVRTATPTPDMPKIPDPKKIEDKKPVDDKKPGDLLPELKKPGTF
jgi:hypothetical protein